MMRWRILITLFFIVVIAILIRFASFQVNPKVTSWDNLGYYSILPQSFIYNDPGNNNIENIARISKEYQLTPYLYQYVDCPNGNHPSRYTIGMAILHTPAFFCGHMVAKLGGYKPDGYSPPYQWSLIVFNLIYILIGLLLLFKLLLNFYTKYISLFLTGIAFFGTNYYSYAIGGYGMPHTYLFLFYVLFIDQTIKWHNNPTNYRSFLLGAILAIMVLVRPTEIMAVLIPLLWGTSTLKSIFSKCMDLLFKYRTQLLFCILGFLVIVFPQLLYWKIYTNKWFFYGYRNEGEGFEFLHPFIFEFLFSFRKGWFVYTPIMVLAIVGLFLAIKQWKPFTNSFLFFTIVYVFVLASWSNWWYAASFGQRSLIQAYPVFILLIGLVITSIKLNSISKTLLYTIILFLVTLNLFQCWQFSKGIIHVDRMTKDYYLATFGRTTVPPGADTLLLVDRINEVKYDFHEKHNYKLVKQYQPDPAKLHNWVYDDQSINLDLLPRIKFNTITNTDHLWVEITFDYFKSKEITAEKIKLLSTALNKRHRGYGIREIPIVGNKDTIVEWKTFTCYFLTPTMRLYSDDISYYLNVKNGIKMQLKNIEIRCYERKY